MDLGSRMRCGDTSKYLALLLLVFSLVMRSYMDTCVQSCFSAARRFDDMMDMMDMTQYDTMRD